MKNSSIKIIPSQYTTKILKGTTLIEETTLLFAHWDINQSNEENLDVSSDIKEKINPVFFGDPLTAAMKAFGLH